MVSRKRKQDLVDEDNVLEVVNDAFSVEEIHGGSQEVPIQALRKSQASGAARDIGNGDNLLEGNDLNSSYDDNDVDVAGEHGPEEASNHDQRPDCAGNEGLLLLLIVGLWGFLLPA